MTEKQDRWNAVLTALIFASFAVGALQALILFAATAPLVLTALACISMVLVGRSVDLPDFEWAAHFAAVAPHLTIFGACAVVFLVAGYGVRRTASDPSHRHLRQPSSSTRKSY